ncbi:citrate lyase acyl carrier protein [Anaerococcus sp. Marseille-P3625]|uniref:citrate lyase acyl carrier protein n=1 Tax=Anaerococcus sp. Marseille-P3625 TaxID=1977277 RepID=UPI000C084835|nr:citrate lyase acyl carrier protein [Anaerococcus sp. Marseille-P3625]
MKIQNKANAGTLESSDAEVSVYPCDELKIEVKSSVYAQFGRQIEETVKEVLDKLDIKAGEVVVDDRGALDCTIRSRVQTAILRANGIKENIPWGDKI